MSFASSNRTGMSRGRGVSARREVRHDDRHPRRRVPRGTTSAMSMSTSRRTGRRGAPRARTRTSSGTSRGRTPNAIPIEPGEEVRTRPPPAPCTGTSARRRDRRRTRRPPADPHRGRHHQHRDPQGVRLPVVQHHRGTVRRCCTPSLDRHVDQVHPPHRVHEPPRRTIPVTCMSTCTPGTTSTDPTSVPAGHHRDAHPDALLEQPAPRDASPGVTRSRSRLAPPSRGALLHVEQLDRVAEEVFRGLDQVVERRVHMNSDSQGSSCSPTSPPWTPRRPYPGPPGAMASPGIPGRPAMANKMFFLAIGARISGIPIEGGAPRPRTGWRPPPEQTPLSLYVT